MIYAVRVNRDARTIELYVSQSGRPLPNGYELCTWEDFRSCWVSRDEAAYWNTRELLARRQARRRGIYPAPEDTHPASVARAASQ